MLNVTPISIWIIRDLILQLRSIQRNLSWCWCWSLTHKFLLLEYLKWWFKTIRVAFQKNSLCLKTINSIFQKTVSNMGEEEILHVLGDKNKIFRFEIWASGIIAFVSTWWRCSVLWRTLLKMFFVFIFCWLAILQFRLQKNKNGEISHKDTVKAYQGKNARWVE